MEFRQYLQKSYGGIDVLINYASVPHKVKNKLKISRDRQKNAKRERAKKQMN